MNEVTIHVRSVDHTRGFADVRRNLRAGIGDMSGDADELGEQVGESLGDGVTRGVDGRLRDSRGRFVAAGRGIGDGIGEGIGDGISRGSRQGDTALGGLERRVTSFRSSVRSTDGPLDSMAGRLAILGSAARTVGMVLKPSIFAELIPVALGAVGAVVQMSGALLVLPGAATSAGLAVGTLKIATLGFGDALKEIDDPEKFAEALKKLSPAAQAAAIAIRDLKGRFDELKNSLQQRLFAGLNTEITKTSNTLMTVLQPAMESIASTSNRVITGMLQDFRALDGAQFRTLGAEGARAFENLAVATRPLVRALLDIAEVGAKVFADITGGAGAAMVSFENLITRIKEGGQLEEIMRSGVSGIQQFGRITVDVFNIIRSVMAAAGQDGQTFLDTLERGTTALANFFASFEGQALVGAFTTTLSLLQSAVMSVTTLSPSVTVFLEAFNEGLRALNPYLPPLVAALGQILEAVSPLLPYLGQIAGILAGALTEALIAVTPLIQQLVPVLGAALLQAVQALAPLLPQLAQAFADMLIQVIPLIPQIAALIPQCVALAQELLPIAIAIMESVLPALIATASIITGQVNGAINSVRELIRVWQREWEELGDAVGVVVDSIAGFFVRLKESAQTEIEQVLQFFRDLPGNITNAVGDLGSILVEAGKAAIAGLFRGMTDWWNNTVVPWLRARAADIANLKGPLTKDRKILFDNGVAIIAGLHRGMLSRYGPLVAWLRQLAGRIQGHIGGGIGADGGIDNATWKTMTAPHLATLRGAGTQMFTAAQGSANLTSHNAWRNPATAIPPITTGGSGSAGAPTVQLRGDDSATARFILELIRNSVRVQGGNVQVVLGP